MLGIIPRSKVKAPLWTRMLFIFSLIVLVVSLSGFFGLDWAEKSTSQKLILAQQETKALITPQNQSLESEVKIAQQQTSYFSNLLQSQQHNSAFLDLIKTNIHPEVILTGFTLDASQAKAELRGRASSFRAMGEQILVLRREVNVKSVILFDLTLDKENRINFALDLELVPGLFK